MYVDALSHHKIDDIMYTKKEVIREENYFQIFFYSSCALKDLEESVQHTHRHHHHTTNGCWRLKFQEKS